MAVKLTKLCALEATGGKGFRQIWVGFSADGKLVGMTAETATMMTRTGFASRLWVWDVGRRKLHGLMKDEYDIRSVHFIDQNRKIVCIWGSLIKVLDASSFKALRGIRRAASEKPEHYRYCYVLPGEKAVIARGHGGLRMFSLKDGKETYSRDLARPRHWMPDAWATDVSRDGRLFAETHDGALYVLDRRTSKERKWDAEEFVSALRFSPDGTKLAAAGIFRSTIWDVQTGKIVHVLDPPGVCRDAAFSPGGQWLAIPANGTLSLWDVSSGQRMSQVSGWDAGVMCVAFSPDGSLLAAGHLDLKGDNFLTLWKVGR